MILWLLNWFGGWHKLIGPKHVLTDFLNLCRSKCYPYWGLTLDEICFSVCMRRRVWRELQTDLSFCELEMVSDRAHGMPYLLGRYRRRWGLIAGFVLMVLLVGGSGKFVWNIKVQGTERYRARDVLEELAEHGFGVGSYIPGVEVNQLQNAVLIDSERFAWMSVNLFGTTANVEVIEVSHSDRPTKTSAPMNLIASADGQITLLSIRDGVPVVGIGDVIRKGELLVSGLGERGDGKTLHISAAGEVYAQVKHQIKIEIPFAYERKVYSNRKTLQTSVIFFGKEIKLSGNTGILGMTCDTIDNERILTFFDRISVPVCLRSVTQLAYTMEPAMRTEEEAKRLAEYMLQRKSEEILNGAELIGRSVDETVNDTGISLECTLYCVQNIAVSAPIYLNDQAESNIERQ